jgi:DNA-binding FadR family transcriptional regulator
MNLPRNTIEPTGTRTHQIADLLARRVLDGLYKVGDRLPTERELAAEFGTNRNAIREAVKRLEGIGMVKARQGSGIYVEEMELSGGVKLLDILVVREDGSVNREFLHDALEFRANVMRMIVRAAAVRRTDAELEEMRRLTQERREAHDDLPRLREVTRSLLRLVAEAAHNRVYLFVLNTTSRAQLQLWDMIDMPLVGFPRLQRTMEQVVEAAAVRDAATAELAIVRLMEDIQRTIFGAVDAVQSMPFAPLPDPSA